MPRIPKGPRKFIRNGPPDKYFPGLNSTPAEVLTARPPDVPEHQHGAKRVYVPRVIKQAFFIKPLSGLPSTPAFIGSGKGWEQYAMAEGRNGIEIAFTHPQTKVVAVFCVPYVSVASYEVTPID